MNTLAFGMPGGWEWVAIGLIMLLLFGSRLPTVARSIGDALREFKKGVHDMSEDTKSPPRQQPRSYESARPPLTQGGVDARVSHGHPVDDDAAEHDRPAPVPAESTAGEAHRAHDDPPRG